MRGFRVVTLATAICSVAPLTGAAAQAVRPPAARQTAAASTTAPDGTTPLHTAVRNGDREKVRALIRARADVNAATKYSAITPLSLAATNGDAETARLLLDAGANANARTYEGETILMTAARTGNPEVLRLLLAHGADINAKEGWYEQTALMWAAAQDHPEAVKVLVEAGADVNVRALTPPSNARGTGGGTATVAPGGLTALLYAARQGALESIKALVDGGADINATDPNSISALVYALINGHYDVAAYLVDKGANPNVVDVTGRGPLFVAVDMHSLEFRFNRPDPKQLDQRTSLDLVKMLLAKGADVNQKLKQSIIAPKGFATGNRNLTAGSTPFLKAATTSDVEMMRLLVEWGADPWALNANGTNALMMAAGLNWKVIYSRGTQEQAIEAVQMLLDLGFDINATNTLGQTALHGAVMRTSDQDANKIVEFLVAKGANLYAKDKKGRTPLAESEGEEITPENGGGDRRGLNPRTNALLLELIKKNPERSLAQQ